MNRRPDGFIPGLGAAQDLLAVAFTLDSGESSDRVFELADKLALVQVLERVQPSPAELDAGVEQEQRRLEQEKLGRYLQAWIDDRRNRLIEENELVVNLDVAGRG
jgi:hypothetical protein